METLSEVIWLCNEIPLKDKKDTTGLQTRLNFVQASSAWPRVHTGCQKDEDFGLVHGTRISIKSIGFH